MDKESVLIKGAEEMEEQFRRIRAEELDRYKKQVEHSEAELEANEKMSAKKIEESRGFIKNLGVDLTKLDKELVVKEKREKRDLQRFLDHRRPSLLDQESNLQEHQRDKIFRSGFYSQFAQEHPTCIGVDILSTDTKRVKKKGKILGNPGVWQYWEYDPNGVQDIISTQSGSGVGACVIAHGSDMTDAIWWFYFIPSATGAYRIWCHMWWHGFYVLRSYRGCVDCKYAYGRVSASIKAYQHFWTGQQNLSIFEREITGGEYNGFISDYNIWEYNTVLTAGQPTWIQVKFSLETSAFGSGSYAELNFSEGPGNYVDAPMIVIMS